MRRLHPRVSPNFWQLIWHRHQQLLGGSHASFPWRLLSSTALGRALPARARVGHTHVTRAQHPRMPVSARAGDSSLTRRATRRGCLRRSIRVMRASLCTHAPRPAHSLTAHLALSTASKESRAEPNAKLLNHELMGEAHTALHENASAAPRWPPGVGRDKLTREGIRRGPHPVAVATRGGLGGPAGVRARAEFSLTLFTLLCRVQRTVPAAGPLPSIVRNSSATSSSASYSSPQLLPGARSAPLLLKPSATSSSASYSSPQLLPGARSAPQIATPRSAEIQRTQRSAQRSAAPPLPRSVPPQSPRPEDSTQQGPDRISQPDERVSSELQHLAKAKKMKSEDAVERMMQVRVAYLFLTSLA